MASSTTTPWVRRAGADVSDDDLLAIDRWWRAANYLSVGQIYLLDNPLLTEPLTRDHIKPRLLGHWGTTPGLYLIYGQGNFIECGLDTPYLQIGELKYGKPILDRALRAGTPLSEAVKLGLISFDSTIRSNIAVGPPLDLIIMPRGRLVGMERRIAADDAYFRDLGQRWSQAMADAHRAMPNPTWLNADAAQPAHDAVA